MKHGFFITFEGGEGCGKSTQLTLLREAMEAAGEPAALVTREPGGTGNEGAEAIRNLLVTGEADKWDDVAEALLFMASRRQHMERTIRPALQEGRHVLCDRHHDSSRVYQGIGKGLGIEFLDELYRLSIGDIKPDLTLVLDLDVTLGLERAGKRDHEENRFESMHENFHESVRRGFLKLAADEPSRVAIVDASGSLEEVHAAILKAIEERLGLALKPVEAA